MRKKRITIADVAEEAGVSTGTVSAVINERPTVHADTRAHVLDVIDALGYQPSPAARHLGRTRNGDPDERTVGIIVKEIANPYYMEVVAGAQDRLEEEGCLAFVTTSKGSYEREEEQIDAFRSRFVSGVIIAPVFGEQVDLSHLFMMRRAGYPFVLLENIPGLPAHAVSIDNTRASQTAVRHLIEQGHERIIHFAGPRYTQHTRDRIVGVERAFSQSHLRFGDDVVVHAGASLEEGYRAALACFRERDGARPTAVTCFNDLVATGVLRALAELDLRVPDDVSVVGFDDIPAAAFLSPPLTTVAVPKRAIGRRAAEMLLTLLEADEELEPEHVVLEAALVERASTGSPR